MFMDSFLNFSTIYITRKKQKCNNKSNIKIPKYLIYCQTYDYNSIVIFLFVVIVMLNQRIHELRTARRISQVKLGEILGVSKQSVSNWENDNIQPSIEILMKLAEYFGVSTDYLLGLEEKRTLDVTGLSSEEVAHIQQIIHDINKK